MPAPAADETGSPPDEAPTELAAALDPEWLASAVRSTNTDRVEVVESQTTMATKCRVELHGPDDATEPDRLCLKGFFAPTELTRLVISNSQSEVRFYGDVASSSLLRSPPVRYAAISSTTGHGLLIMEDLKAAGARFFTALDDYGVDRVAQSLGQLAILHAESWDSSGAAGMPWLENRLERFVADKYLPDDTVQALLDDGRAEGLSDTVHDARALFGALSDLLPLSASGPQSLVHGDAHVGNAFELNAEASLIDWQLLQRACWALDVSYHVTAALPVEARRASEESLLKHYLGELRRHGGPEMPWDEAWTQYRMHLVYGYYLWAITRMVQRDVIVELVQRLGAAVADHDAINLVRTAS